MTYIEKLVYKIVGSGWFGGSLKMNILIENEFEGFYGKASETWENRITISIDSPNDCAIPSLRLVGTRYDNINTVAQKVLDKIEAQSPKKASLSAELSKAKKKMKAMENLLMEVDRTSFPEDWEKWKKIREQVLKKD